MQSLTVNKLFWNLRLQEWRLKYSNSSATKIDIIYLVEMCFDMHYTPPKYLVDASDKYLKIAFWRFNMLEAPRDLLERKMGNEF